MTIKDLRKAIAADPARSAWTRGVKLYALELLEGMDDNAELCGSPTDMNGLLNGADNWGHYSYGGCSLAYDADIAARLCSPSELRKCKGGDRQPNSREEWLDVQARALWQASRMIRRLARG